MIPEASQSSLLTPLGEVDEQPSLDLKWSEFSYRHAVPVQLSWELLQAEVGIPDYHWPTELAEFQQPRGQLSKSFVPNAIPPGDVLD